MIPDTATLDTAHFAVAMTVEVVAVGLIAIVVVACVIWLYDFVRGLFR